MPNNRANYQSTKDIIRMIQSIEKPFTIFSGEKITVEEGWSAVLIANGEFDRVLKAGRYSLHQLFGNSAKSLKITEVSNRIHSLEIDTKGDMYVNDPIPAGINSTFSVSFQVVDPAKFLFTHNTPLIELYDKVMSALQKVLALKSIFDFISKRNMIEKELRQVIEEDSMTSGLREIGIQIKDISIAVLNAVGPGARLIEDVALQSYSNSHLPVTDEWLWRNHPDLAVRIREADTQLIKGLVEQGYLDHTFLSRLLNGANPLIVSEPVRSYLPSPLNNAKDRMNHEIKYLKDLPGVNVQTDQTEADNSHDIRVDLSLASSRVLSVYFHCTNRFPQERPDVAADVDEQPAPVISSTLRNWSEARYLVDIVRDIQNQYR